MAQGYRGKAENRMGSSACVGGEVRAASHLEEAEKEVQTVIIAAIIIELITLRVLLSALSLNYFI